MPSPPRHSRIALALGAAVALAIGLGCGAQAPPGAGGPPSGVAVDAGLDGAPGADSSPSPPIAEVPCTDDGPCDDGFACTDDRCDPARGRCAHATHDERCDDRVFCNGIERCSLRRGCIPGGDVCRLGNACSVARCDEAERRCTTVPRDVDGDGDPDAHCGGTDCDDTDPRRSGRMVEVCDNAVDDNCNGSADDEPCTVAEGNLCPSPIALDSEGERTVSTAGGTAPPPSGCAFPLAAQAKTIFVAVPRRADRSTVLEVVDGPAPITLARLLSCTAPAIACEQGSVMPFPRLRLPPSAAPGHELVAVTTTTPATLRLRTLVLPVDSNVGTSGCTGAEPIVPGRPVRVDFTSNREALPSDCNPTGMRTFALEVPTASRVVLEATSLTGRGAATVGLRDHACIGLEAERACRTTASGPLILPAVAAGSYVITVSTLSAPSVELTATLSPPEALDAGSSCTFPAEIEPGQRIAIPLDGRADLVRSGCMGGVSALAYRVHVPTASDVLLVARIPTMASGGLAVLDATCTQGFAQSCAFGGTPLRTLRRGEPQGHFFASLAATTGGSGSLAVYTRPPLPDTPVTDGGSCATAVAVTTRGGHFTGDSTGLPSTVGSACDMPQVSPRAPTQLFALTLPRRLRVLLSTTGSTFPTILAVRSGAACPGSELPSACNTGYDSTRSFLDRVLEAGTHWIVLTGYAGAKGAWVLDAFVVDP